jgi:hypothetical protein
MSLSECQKCGGHIPLGPDASNICEDCGSGVFDTNEPAKCTWTEDDDGNWETSCQNMYIFIEDGPKENQHKYCPYCGRWIIAVYAS